jgi:hypothetical protein
MACAVSSGRPMAAVLYGRAALAPGEVDKPSGAPMSELSTGIRTCATKGEIGTGADTDTPIRLVLGIAYLPADPARALTHIVIERPDSALRSFTCLLLPRGRAQILLQARVPPWLLWTYATALTAGLSCGSSRLERIGG